jgi:hypothetical protein
MEDEAIAQSRADTLDHIGKVQRRMGEVITSLHKRAQAHDASKLQEPELSGYASLHTQMKATAAPYGSPEYRAIVEAHRPTVAHHYAANSHHPEHYPGGILGMSLLDVVEMLADWKAAGEREPGGSLGRSIEMNIEQRRIEPMLAALLRNTARELGWL